MVSRGQFDEVIRSELRGRGNVNRGDAQQEARDRAARRLNVKSGKNPNPRTSTAYKPTEPRKATPSKSKSRDRGGGGRKGVPLPGQRPSGLPGEAPIPGVRPTDDGGMDPNLWMLPFIMAGVARRKGVNAEMPGPETRLPVTQDVPPNPVQLQRVPNAPEDVPLLPPPSGRQLTYNPADALPPPTAGGSSPMEEQITRFLMQGDGAGAAADGGRAPIEPDPNLLDPNLGRSDTTYDPNINPNKPSLEKQPRVKPKQPSRYRYLRTPMKR